ncbi:MAG TPA: OmpW family outer membrane protein [Candidatus Competibacter sp.]|nr:OmpW family outer membrane protein [Candidatus Competibacter sp.]
MSSKMLKSVLTTVLAGGLLAGAAQAYEAGDWIVRAGVWGVFPKSDNLDTPLGMIEVDNGYSLGINGTYMFTPNIGLEVIGALPFKHDINLDGTKIASTYQLPPTVLVQYHFMPTGTIHPYAGVGLNYTFFWDEKTTGPLSGTKLSLDPSWGLAGELGIDIDVAPNWFVNATVSYMDIDTKAKSNVLGTLGTVEIDPWVVGLNVGTRF